MDSISGPGPSHPSILFVTANPPTPSDEAATWIGKIETYLHDLLAALRARNATVTLRTFQDPTLTASTLATTYTHILFLAADRYIHHMPAFTTFLTTTLPTAQRLNPTLRIHNPPSLLAWNANKTYLRDLAPTFPIPHTTYLPATTSWTLSALPPHLPPSPSTSTPLILKPSIAASGHSTHLLPTPHAPTPTDATALAAMRAHAAPGAQLMLQEYLPRIAHPDGGEWSFVVVRGAGVTHAVRKRPRRGEFRINSAFGGVWEVMRAGDGRVPACGVEVAGRVWGWLVGREREGKKGRKREGEGETETELLYARVDGVVGEGGEFVLMEVELIEPWLWLVGEGPGRVGLEAFCDAVLGGGGEV